MRSEGCKNAKQIKSVLFLPTRGTEHADQGDKKYQLLLLIMELGSGISSEVLLGVLIGLVGLRGHPHVDLRARLASSVWSWHGIVLLKS